MCKWRPAGRGGGNVLRTRRKWQRWQLCTEMVLLLTGTVAHCVAYLDGGDLCFSTGLAVLRDSTEVLIADHSLSAVQKVLVETNFLLFTLRTEICNT